MLPPLQTLVNGAWVFTKTVVVAGVVERAIANSLGYENEGSPYIGIAEDEHLSRLQKASLIIGAVIVVTAVTTAITSQVTDEIWTSSEPKEM